MWRIFLVLIVAFMMWPSSALAQCQPDDPDCDTPINQGDKLDHPYDVTPYDYENGGNVNIDLTPLTDELGSADFLSALGKSSITAWLVIWRSNKFFMEWVLLIVAVSTFFWLAWWIVKDKNRFEPALGSGDWKTSNPYNPNRPDYSRQYGVNPDDNVDYYRTDR